MMQTLKKLDWPLIVAACLLVAIGLLSIYSSSLSKDDFSNFKKQIAFAAVGFFLMFFFCFFDWRIFRENTNLILILYLFSLLGLAGLFFFAPEIRGVHRWYKVGPFSVDPIEFTKIILVILLAKYFSMRHIEMYRARHILFSGFYVLLPAALTFFQPDFGSIISLLALWLGVLVISGIKLRHFFVLFFCGILIFSLAWLFLMKDYQKDRIISFMASADPLGSGWSQNQAKIAIGSGGIFGQGLFKGSQTQYGFLPEPQTDFIFAAIAEETGLIGVSVLLFLFLILIWRIFKIAVNSQSNFPRLFSIGLIIIMISQLFIHIGMNLGILPIIGISLPLVSYGGSSLIATLAALGIIQNIKNNP
ncbi:MAG TPA: rod shape-determining protein RodA [Patescibacteria group bacterium]|nr:rod shape-determining protein RodA [Patescibacteria group bacterium]